MATAKNPKDTADTADTKADPTPDLSKNGTPADDEVNPPWFAKGQIFIDGGLGYVAGDEVPDQVVVDHDLADSVSRDAPEADAKA